MTVRPPDPNHTPPHGNQMVVFVAASLRANFLSGAVLSFAFVVGGSWNSGLMRGEEQMEEAPFFYPFFSSFILLSFLFLPGAWRMFAKAGGVGGGRESGFTVGVTLPQTCAALQHEK